MTYISDIGKETTTYPRGPPAVGSALALEGAEMSTNTSQPPMMFETAVRPLNNSIEHPLCVDDLMIYLLMMVVLHCYVRVLVGDPFIVVGQPSHLSQHNAASPARICKRSALPMKAKVRIPQFRQHNSGLQSKSVHHCGTNFKSAMA